MNIIHIDICLFYLCVFFFNYVYPSLTGNIYLNVILPCS